VLNVNATAKHLTPAYSGPLINVADDPLLSDARGKLSDATLVKDAVEAFSNLATPPIHAALDVNTGMGFSCDAACLLNAEGKPLAVKGHDLTAAGSPVPNSQK